MPSPSSWWVWVCVWVVVATPCLLVLAGDAPESAAENVDVVLQDYDSKLHKLFTLFWRYVAVNPDFADPNNKKFFVVQRLLDIDMQRTLEGHSLQGLVRSIGGKVKQGASESGISGTLASLSELINLGEIRRIISPISKCLLSSALSHLGSSKAASIVCRAHVESLSDSSDSADQRRLAPSLALLAHLERRAGNSEEADRRWAQARNLFSGSSGLLKLVFLGFSALEYGRQGSVEAALRELQEAEALARTELSRKSPVFLLQPVALSILTVLYEKIGAAEDADRLAEEITPMVIKIFGKRHPVYSVTKVLQAIRFDARNQPAAADQAYQDALYAAKSLQGDMHVATLLGGNALRLDKRDSVLDGAEMARQSIEVLKPRLEKVQKRMQSGEEAELSTLDKMALPLGLAIFALHDEMVGEAEESEQLVKKTIKHTMEAHDGPKFWGYAMYLGLLGIRHDYNGETEEANAAYEELLRTAQRLAGKDLRYGIVLALLGLRAEVTGSRHEAEKLFQEAMQLLAGPLNLSEERILSIDFLRFSLLQAISGTESSILEARESLVSVSAKLEPILRRDMDQLLLQLRELVTEMSKTPKLYPEYPEAFLLLSSLFMDTNSLEYLHVLEHSVSSLYQVGKSYQGRAYLPEILALMKTLESQLSVQARAALLELVGDVYFAVYAIVDAIPMFEKSLDLWTEAKDSVSELRVIRKLLLALARVNRSEKTDALRARALKLAQRLLGTNSSEYLAFLLEVAGLNSEEIWREVLRLAKPDSSEEILALLRLARIYIKSCNYKELGPIMTRIVSKNPILFDEFLEEYASVLSYEGSAQLMQGRTMLGQTHLQTALRASKKHTAKDDVPCSPITDSPWMLSMASGLFLSAIVVVGNVMFQFV